VNERADDIQAPYFRILSADDIVLAIDSAGVRRDRAVIVLVGGAGGIDGQDLESLRQVLQNDVVPVAERLGAAVIDGGTDSGVMRLMGRARSGLGGRFPLVGVAAEGTVVVPGTGPPSSDAVELEPNHTLFLLVPGTQWGDEARWITQVAAIVAGSGPSVTILVNGGQIAYTDVSGSLSSGRPVVVLAGSGRTADAIAEARAGNGGDARAVEIAASPLTTVVQVEEPGAVAVAIEAALDFA
jgi:SLOG in TRPM, prokaryote